MSEGRSAGRRHEERLVSGKDTQGIIESVRTFRELDTTYRVYRKDWLLDGRFASQEAAQSHGEAVYAGRLEDGDIEVRADDIGGWILWTKRWNVVGEWKTQEQAGAHLTELSTTTDHADLRIVARNSRAEVVLRNYGVLKLVSRVRGEG